MSSNSTFSRRYFFYGSLLAAPVPLAGYGSVASLKALGYKPYYNKLNVAAIGCGGRGEAILGEAAVTENIVALCDVDESRAARAYQKYATQPKYKDFRVMLDKEAKNIDGCTIGVPDHMHATIALACMQRGISVYVEKPLTRTPWEARLLADAAVKYKVATQMGNQGYSHESLRVTAEMLWSGAIGDVKEVHVSCSPGTHPTALQQLPGEASVPKNLDWDLWLGGASMRPYAPDHYAPYNWRGFFDFGTGQLGNWGIHSMGPVNFALQLGAPISVELIKAENSSKWTFPSRAVLRFEFPQRGGMPPVTIYWHDSARNEDAEAYRVPGMENEVILPPSDNLGDKGRGATRAAGSGGSRKSRPTGGPRTGAGGPGVRVFGEPGSPAQNGILTGNGAVFVGSKGMMATVSRGEGVHLLPHSKWADYVLPPQLLTRSPGHMADWIRFAKGGEPSCSHFGISGPYAEWMTLGAIAFRYPGKLLWDSKTLRITNNPEANQHVKPAFRKGWELKL